MWSVDINFELLKTFKKKDPSQGIFSLSRNRRYEENHADGMRPLLSLKLLSFIAMLIAYSIWDVSIKLTYNFAMHH
jgi:hypothetical protein